VKSNGKVATEVAAVPVAAAAAAAAPEAAVARPPAAARASQPPPTDVAVIAEPVKLARARAELLCDPGTFHPHRSAVGDGVIAGAGKVGGRAVYIWAQDVSFKGGSLGSKGGETIVRTMEMAERAWAPVVGFPHSGGARLQEGVAALGAYASIFRAQARSNALQISVIGGPCAGGGAYSPALGDLVMMAGPESQMFLTGPKIIERVTREIVTAVELGGPKVHAKTGVSHLDAVDDTAASDLVRSVLAHLPGKAGGALPLAPPREPPAGDPSRHVPANQRKVYDVRDVIRHLVDGGFLLEIGARWARNMVVGLARIDGRPIGVVANQPRYLGGTLDADAADKGAWFVDFCNKFGLPIVVLADTPGFRPGVKQERAAVLRRGANLLRAFAVSHVPRVTVTLRQAYGGAHIVMNCRDLGHDLTFAWPSARIGVMGATQAIEITKRRELAAGGDAAALAADYEAEHLPVGVAAAAGFVDEIVEPTQTRERIAAHFGAHR
jgi:acetyl-CoA carboxylase carboxyltransferase component